MYIKPTDPQITNRSNEKPKRLRPDGARDFAEEVEALLDTVSIEHIDPDQQKKERERSRNHRRQPGPDSEPSTSTLNIVI
ncbi:MAG: hypothetical protein KDD69_02485 [Bdellovibrionales bacterium]|nr:hypothetical protein [Bdellovibrionales bacterium]